MDTEEQPVRRTKRIIKKVSETGAHCPFSEKEKCFNKRKAFINSVT